MKGPAISEPLAQLAVNTIKMLAVDAVEKANSGHPGMPMGAAHYAFILWTRYLRFDPSDPQWPNRDRFVLSAGHGSMLLYAMLHLSGYDLSLDDLKQFRQGGSRTPGHPEYGHTPGVEVTTGPLGQGFANGVGLAIGARRAATEFNTASRTLYGNRVYGIVSDGDLMEGISHEAASLAGHLGLSNLTYLYDDNLVTLSAPTSVTETDDVVKRFEGCGWFVQRADGRDHAQIERALDAALAEKNRPQLIAFRTHLADGAPNAHDTYQAHGAPLGAKEVALTKQALGWPTEPTFRVPPEVYALFAERVSMLKKEHADWEGLREAWAKENPEMARQWRARLQRESPPDLFDTLRANVPAKAEATRNLSAEIEQQVAKVCPDLFGGSADLDPSTKTNIKGSGFLARGEFSGRNIMFGVREHAMGAICNGLAVYGGFMPFASTFLIFSDYMRPAIRLAALSKLRVIYVFTHDSVMLGEDGPTHEPVEQLASLRLIPNLHLFRPADALECAAAWAHAVGRKDGPTAFALTRQKIPVLEHQADFDPQVVRRGGYVVNRADRPNLVLLATGSEVSVMADAAKLLAPAGYRCQLVSLPCLELFREQPAAYRDQVIPKGIARVSLEAGRTDPWLSWVGEDGLALGIDRFGASAPDNVIAEKYGLTAASVAERIRARFGERAPA
jgi:transketolase